MTWRILCRKQPVALDRKDRFLDCWRMSATNNSTDVSPATFTNENAWLFWIPSTNSSTVYLRISVAIVQPNHPATHS